MSKSAVTENLTKDAVNIIIVTTETTEVELSNWNAAVPEGVVIPEGISLPEGPTTRKEEREVDRWRVALQNTVFGRKQLQDVLYTEYPEEYAEVMAVWGDEPTVEMPALPIPPDMPEALRESKSLQQMVEELTDDIKMLAARMDDFEEAARR